MKKVSIHAVQRLFWILVAVIACSLTTLLITPRQAQALSGNCSAEMVYDAVGTRGKGRCSSLGSDTKAQVTLDISIGVDRHSAYGGLMDPALVDAEELELAVEDGVRFLELVAPVEQANGKLKCEVMKLGDPDEKGRRSPVPTGEFTEIDCDTVIAAVGERVDSDLFTANGIEVNTKGIPEFRTNLENVFVGGDAMRGPATVVEGIADAQYFANAVIGSVHSVAIPDDAHATRDEAIARKGVLCPPKAGCEGERCLHCNTVCQVCADVCPNRANVVITLPDGRHEILHVDRMCNECGNCAVFCPYDSAPYRNKFTLFLTREGFDESTENQGFLPLEGRKVLVRLDGKVFEADLDGQNQLPADVETFILTVLKDYAYLL